MESLQAELATHESVLIALIGFLIIGERPKEAARDHLMQYFANLKGEYYKDDSST